MNFITKLLPKFLKSYDAYLRVNHTWLWATRIHINLYLALLLNLVFIVLTFLYPTSITNAVYHGDVSTYFGLLFIPAALFFGLIVYQMALFNTDKSYAHRFRFQETWLFLIYFVSLVLPLSIPYTSAALLSERVAYIEKEDQLQNDLKVYSYGQMFFPISSAQYDYFESNEDYSKDLEYRKKEYRKVISAEKELWFSLQPTRDSISGNIFRHKFQYKNQRPRLFFNYHNLDRSYYYGEGNYSYRNHGNWINDVDPSGTILLDLQRFNFNPSRDLATERIAEFSQLIKKYSSVDEIDEAQVLSDFFANNYVESYAYKDLRDYIFEARDNLLNIKSAHDKRAVVWNSEVFEFFLLWAFCLTLLFQAFKNVHWSQLIRSALVCGLLLTVLVVISVLTPHRLKVPIIVSAYFPLFLLFFSLNGFKLQRFSTRYLQINIILNFFLPFFPLMFWLYLDEVHKLYSWSVFDGLREAERIKNPNRWNYDSLSYSTRRQLEYIVLWCGILFYVFVGNNYLKSLYLRYWSLPKKK